MAADDLQKIRERYKNREFYRLWPEWEALGLWAPKKIGMQAVGILADLEDFSLGEPIRQRLIAWHERYNNQIPERAFEILSEAEFLAEGLDIARDLSREFSGEILIEYEIDDRVLLFENGKCVVVVKQEQTKI
jgi:hypothetical protein